MSMLDIHDPNTTLAGVIERVRQGEEVTLSEEGKPLAMVFSVQSEPAAADWKEAWRKAAGMWKDRHDLPELMAQIKQDWNRAEPPDGQSK
jgi:prevent-host-death family protein